MADQEAQILTYGSLLADVQAYSERDDEKFINQIPRFILLAEKSIAREFKSLWELNVARLTLLQNQVVVEKPALWRKTVSVTVNGQSLYERTTELVKKYGEELTPAAPQYWTDYDYNNILIAPAPDVAGYLFELTYFQQAQPLSPINAENLISREAPQLLLFGTMLQAAYFEKSTSKIGYWSQQYGQIKQNLLAEDQLRIVDRNTSVQQG